ncbi:MAG: 3-hydroxyacyl-CoA dehydrogenase family protein [Candidatus Rickettsiella isopodorum]
MKKISVIGSGVMGSGVAHLFAQHNYHVTLIDIADSQLSQAKNSIIDKIRYNKLAKFSNHTDSASEIASRINFSSNIQEAANANFIIENITENWKKKRDLYRKLNDICSLDSILAVNTSAVPITKIASSVTNPGRVIGLHFMNPVVLMPMVEMIKGYHTSDEVIKKTKKILNDVKKKYIVVNDSPGFVTNRAMMIFVNEAIFMLQEKVAAVEDIDTLFRQCFGHKMGPLQTADLIGLDTILYSLEVLYEEFKDSKYRPCWLLEKMVSAGLHGEKSKQGFYSYV